MSSAFFAGTQWTLIREFTTAADSSRHMTGVGSAPTTPLPPYDELGIGRVAMHAASCGPVRLAGVTAYAAVMMWLVAR